MKKSKKKVLFGVAAALLLVILSCGGWWAWCYFYVPEFPTDKEYKTVGERAEDALAFAEAKNLSTRYALFVDYGVASGTPRLYVWDFTKKKIIARTYVMHGPGMGSTAERPVFSNKAGSNCSALGRFFITHQHGNMNKSGYFLRGLDYDNRNAYSRGLMIHCSKYLDSHVWMKYIPLHPASCLGCVTVTTKGLKYISKLVQSEERPILLWNYCTKR